MVSQHKNLKPQTRSKKKNNILTVLKLDDALYFSAKFIILFI